MATPTRWGLVWLVTLAGAVAAFQIGKMPASLPALRDDLALGLVGAGIIASMISLIGVCIGSAIGSFADRLGHLRAIMASLVLVAAASGAGALAGERPGTKQALLIDLLKRKNGATIAELVEATGWQPHSVRGAISGALKKKLGLAVTSAPIENRGRVYQIAPRAAGRASRR